MSIVEQVHEALWRQPADDGPGGDVEARIRALVNDAMPLAAAAERDDVVAAVRARVNGLGPLQPFLDDEQITEIMVNAGREVWVEREGRLARVDCTIGPDDVVEIARRLAAAVGRRIDRTSPAVDLRLADGSRMHAVLPPLAVDGPALTVRRFRTMPFTLDELAPPAAVELLREAVRRRASIVVAGGTSTGKTTLLNALVVGADSDDRIVTIEDAAELRIPHRHVVRLEARPAIGPLPPIDLRELVRNALRMRPDRIICGEMRGAEAFDLVQAMNTGHQGSITTVHANGPADALRRIETMMLLAGAELPLRAARVQLAACIDLVVMMRRRSEGARTVVRIDEVPEEPSTRWPTRRLVDGAERVSEPSRPWSAS